VRLDHLLSKEQLKPALMVGGGPLPGRVSLAWLLENVELLASVLVGSMVV
jgi:hypothetical protein